MDRAWKKTACILCECNCGIEVELGGDDGRRLVRFRGDKEHPVSKGYACEKPHRLDYYQHGRDRLTQPLRRRPDGTFEPIDWDTAIREVAQRLAKVRDDHGGDTIFYYGGGGQGNHLPGAYSTATRRVLNSRYRSSALAQEKTGEFWVSERMVGGYTRGDFEHCEVAMFVGKNPWYSHSIPRARVTLKEIAKDPARTMIVIDPRRTKTAQMADIHLQVKPGRDAWLLGAMVAVLLQNDQFDAEFIEAHCSGFEQVHEVFRTIDISQYCEHAGVDEALVRRATEVIANANTVASFEDLGVQMNHHSTLVSYLHRLLWMCTGNFGKEGTQYIPMPLLAIADGKHKRDSPVAGARIIGGMVPCNVIAEEILSDHDRRYRAMIVEAANPAHSLADSASFRAAMNELDTVVVIDVAMTETARLADYVLPASTQFEKAEATFFNLEFPGNFFHLRRALFEPPQGPLPEAEIHARLVEALNPIDDALITSLREAADKGLDAYAEAFTQKVAFNPKLSGISATILYRTLGPSLGEGLAEGAVLWGLALRCALGNAPSLARAGFKGTPVQAANALFEAIVSTPSGIVFSVDEWEHVMPRVGTPDKKIQLALDDLLDEARGLAQGPAAPDLEFPFTLSAGERRAFTANTIVRDPRWRKKDGEGALRISHDDAERLGVSSGQSVRLKTRRGAVIVSVDVSDTMRAGHVSLPNGMGLELDGPLPEGAPRGGVAPNELTAAEDRDPFVGTPWHKSVPASIEVLSA